MFCYISSCIISMKSNTSYLILKHKKNKELKYILCFFIHFSYLLRNFSSIKLSGCCCFRKAFYKSLQIFARNFISIIWLPRPYYKEDSCSYNSYYDSSKSYESYYFSSNIFSFFHKNLINILSDVIYRNRVL